MDMKEYIPRPLYSKRMKPKYSLISICSIEFSLLRSVCFEERRARMEMARSRQHYCHFERANKVRFKESQRSLFRISNFVYYSALISSR